MKVHGETCTRELLHGPANEPASCNVQPVQVIFTCFAGALLIVKVGSVVMTVFVQVCVAMGLLLSNTTLAKLVIRSPVTRLGRELTLNVTIPCPVGGEALGGRKPIEGLAG